MRSAAALPLTALLSACGLAGSATLSQPIPSDGIANFGEASPIELCVGTAAVVAPSAATGAAALCVQSSASGASCTSDATCDGIERCVCGRCIVEACQGAAACGDGRVCRNKRCTTSCAVDTECVTGERCVTGGCARECSGDGDCHFGERCDALESVCSTKLCTAQVPCGAGDSCEAVQLAGELHEPEIVTVSGETIAFVELRTGGASPSSVILRARVESGDVARWVADPVEPVLGGGQDGDAAAPSVIVRDDRLDLYFATGNGAAIMRAFSLDGGRTFGRDLLPVIVPAEPWENGFVGSPAIVQHDGQTAVFYEGGPRAGIGVAYVHDRGRAVRGFDNPVVTPASVEDPLFWRGVTEVSAPFAIKADGALRLYFTARGAEGGDALAGEVALPAERNDSVGLVTTHDLRAYDPYPTGPVFARIANLRAYLGEREPVVRLLPEGAEITFVASDASGTRVTGLSRSGP